MDRNELLEAIGTALWAAPKPFGNDDVHRIIRSVLTEQGGAQYLEQFEAWFRDNGAYLAQRLNSLERLNA